VKGLLSAVAIALLAILAVPGSVAAASDRSHEAHLTSAPLAQRAFVSQDGIALRPCLPDLAPTAGDSSAGVVPDLQTPAAAGRPFVLVAAQLREKYRAFRESLTSP
jgi:hypothetical protein